MIKLPIILNKYIFLLQILSTHKIKFYLKK